MQYPVNSSFVFFFWLIVNLTIVSGCSKGLNNQFDRLSGVVSDIEFTFSTQPSDWNIGDSVHIQCGLYSLTDSVKIMGLEYSAWEAADSMSFEYPDSGINMNLIWVPDSVPFHGVDSLSFVVTGTISRSDSLIDISRKVPIKTNASGDFYFVRTSINR